MPFGNLWNLKLDLRRLQVMKDEQFNESLTNKSPDLSTGALTLTSKGRFKSPRDHLLTCIQYTESHDFSAKKKSICSLFCEVVLEAMEQERRQSVREISQST